MSQENHLFLFKEAQDYLKVSRSTLYRLMWSGQLLGYKVATTWRFYKHDLDKCIELSPVPLSQQIPSSEPSNRLCSHTETQLWCPHCIAYATLPATVS